MPTAHAEEDRRQSRKHRAACTYECGRVRFVLLCFVFVVPVHDPLCTLHLVALLFWIYRLRSFSVLSLTSCIDFPNFPKHFVPNAQFGNPHLSNCTSAEAHNGSKKNAQSKKMSAMDYPQLLSALVDLSTEEKSIELLFSDSDLSQNEKTFIEILYFSPLGRAGTPIDMMLRRIGKHLTLACACFRLSFQSFRFFPFGSSLVFWIISCFVLVSVFVSFRFRFLLVLTQQHTHHLT